MIRAPSDVEQIGVGMLGSGFMGKAHSLAYRAVSAVDNSLALHPVLVSIAGRSATNTERARRAYGWKETSDWERLVSDPCIGLFDNVGPNDLHVEPTIIAFRSGKHVLCEKPFGPDAGSSFEMWREASRAGVVHMCGYNYRFVPALQLARSIIEAGELGEIHHYRSTFLLSSALDETRLRTWRDDRKRAGSGALGILGSHHIDLARFLVGEIESVSAVVRTFVREKYGAPVDVDDSFVAIAQFSGGAHGAFEASQVPGGRLVTSRVEVDGSRGCLSFDLSRLNELDVIEGSNDRRTVNVTKSEHPYSRLWWPNGHPLGWSESFVHQAKHLLCTIARDRSVGPLGATFEDGYRCAEICAAILRASESRASELVPYRSLPAGEPGPRGATGNGEAGGRK